MFKKILKLLVLLIIASAIFIYAKAFFVSYSNNKVEPTQNVDVVLVGGGIMSATLGTYLSELEPEWKMTMFEKLDGVALESSNGWNNAGTGHAGYMELNYTPMDKAGNVNIDKAVKTNESFEHSKQFWAYQVKKGVMDRPETFIKTTPNIAFVTGEGDVNFLKNRYAALSKSFLFKNMEFSDNPDVIKEWAPLIIEGRDPSEKVAATRVVMGNDVNYGEITRQLVRALERKGDTFNLKTRHQVEDIIRNDDGTWKVVVLNLENGKKDAVNAKFVFIGAGGYALHLLQKTGIPESKNYAGFPVGGSWLVSNNPEIAARHTVKVYGKAAAGSPPMSVPHLDARRIDGQEVVMFGPFATWSPKFLKHGSFMDLPSSITLSNIFPMVKVGLNNFGLTQYLVGQLLLNEDDRVDELKKYYPGANGNDWEFKQAGQRVQIIKNDPTKGAILQFGTEVISSSDGSIAALLGASPGASTSPSIMLDVLSKSFKDRFKTPQWQEKIAEIIPTYGKDMSVDEELVSYIRKNSGEALNITYSIIQEDNLVTVVP